MNKHSKLNRTVHPTTSNTRHLISYDSYEESTSSEWLRSEDGVQYMKIFVLINTIFAFFDYDLI